MRTWGKIKRKRKQQQQNDAGHNLIVKYSGPEYT